MSKAQKVTIKQVLQICVVVRNLQKSMELYWDVFGIGPWRILTFKPPTMTNTKVRGKPVTYSMKLGLAQIGNIQWELIQPLTGQSIYKEFLDQKGEGLHHIACDVGDYDKAVANLQKHGIDILMSGDLPGESYAYMDTEKCLGAIFEIYKRPSGFEVPSAEDTYPSSA
ncbi:VOC family protein [Chloroflexota bacterium]